MKKSIIFLSLLLAAGWHVRAQSTAEKIKAVEKNLGGWVKIKDSTGWNINDRMAYYHINGLSIAVIDNYKIVWAKGYGWADTAGKRPVTVNTLFQPASAGKSIHAVGTMKLVQSGKLDPDRDINYYLKTWKFPYDTVSHGKKITTRQLLGHMAGLSVHGFDGYKWNVPLPNLAQILNGTPPANNAAVRSIFEPGKQFEYSGGGYAISGLVDEDITGEPYAAYMSKTIFKPLGMKNTYYNSRLTAEPKKDMATAYRFDGQNIGCKYHIYPEDACGASLWSTPTDFAKFLLELQLSLKNKSNKILSAETIKEMFTPQTTTGHNALGFFVEQRGDATYFHHDGLNEGFVSDYFASIDGGRGVVIMANTDLATDLDITEEICNSVATVYGWKGFYTPVVKQEVKIPDSLMKKYAGRYKFREDQDQHVDIYLKNGKLWFNSGAPVAWQIHFTDIENFFFNEAANVGQSFTKDADGNVDGFMVKTPGGEFKAKRVK